MAEGLAGAACRPVAATVVAAERWKLGQLKPGDTIRFRRVTAEAAKQLNIKTDVMPSTYTIPALVDALVEHFANSIP